MGLVAHYQTDLATQAILEGLMAEHLPPSPLYYRGLVNLQRDVKLDMMFVQQLNGLLTDAGVKHPKKTSTAPKVTRPKKEKVAPAESVKAAKKPPKKIKPKKGQTVESSPAELPASPDAVVSTAAETTTPIPTTEPAPYTVGSILPATPSRSSVDMARWKDKTGYSGPVGPWYQRAIAGGSRYSEGPVPWDRILFYAINKGCPLKYSSMATICGISEEIVKNIVMTQYHSDIVTVTDIAGELFTITLNQPMVVNG
jgi:hypothetical protein